MNRYLFLYAMLGTGMLGASFWLLRSPAPAEPPRSNGVAAAPAAAREFEIRRGHLIAGTNIIRASQGDQLRISVLSDQSAELHLHGYDLRLRVKAGVRAELKFVAEHSGRFELELHGASEGNHQALSVIEIAPR